MTSESRKQTIAIHILPNISRSKINQTETWSVKKYNKTNIFCKNHAETEAGRQVPDFFLFLEKVLYEIKASGLQLSFNIFR